MLNLCQIRMKSQRRARAEMHRGVTKLVLKSANLCAEPHLTCVELALLVHRVALKSR